MDINYDYYKVFYYASKFMNYTKAGESLFVSQSSVSQSIKNLEKALGVELFYRSGKSMAHTEEGKILYEYVKKALQLFEYGEKAIIDMNSLERGNINIGASDTVSRYYLMDYIRKFYKDYPNIKISINNRPSLISKTLVEKGELDFAVINIDPSIVYKNLNVKKIKSIKNLIVVSKDFMENKIINSGNLFEHTIISLEEKSTTRKIFDNYFKEKKIDFKPQLEFGSVDIIIEMVKMGVGLGFVNSMAVEKELSSGDLVEVKLNMNLPSIDIGIIYNENIPLSKASKKFIEMIKENMV
ncbi:LysR family transcriptional regulator [Helicovermis profundi]|uniref:LysR family transcriptional regulator n=1 Tax=Helicovermis profundi TaxID=3065157 RepID=A0AAU9E1R4_9FIRM|nr:LysR family transcriptional regulator [Clostridia bacterium S502]